MLRKNLLISGLLGAMSLGGASAFVQAQSDAMDGSSTGSGPSSVLGTEKGGLNNDTTFQDADTNSDGALDETEARVSGLDPNTLDTNDDGYITREEYERNS